MADVASHTREIFYIGTNEKDGITRCFTTSQTNINTEDATMKDVEYLLFIERIGVNKSIGHLRFHFVYNKHEETDGQRIYKNHWHIDDFAISPDFRSRGYGTILLKALMDFAKKCKVRTITGKLSYVDEMNFDRSKYLYTKMGFAINGLNLRCTLE